MPLTDVVDRQDFIALAALKYRPGCLQCLQVADQYRRRLQRLLGLRRPYLRSVYVDPPGPNGDRRPLLEDLKTAVSLVILLGSSEILVLSSPGLVTFVPMIFFFLITLRS